MRLYAQQPGSSGDTAIKEREFFLTKTSRLRLISLAVLFAALRAAAQPILVPTSVPFAERLTDRVPVSGRTLVGLLSVPGPLPPDGNGLVTGRLAVAASLVAAGKAVCVRATTQDGRYSAENNFVVEGEGRTAGLADLSWPTQYAETLRGFPLSEVAAVARLGSCTDDADIIPIALGAGGTGPVTLQVLVNTRGAAITAALRDPETGRTLRRANCTRVAGTARVAFDARCMLGNTTGLPARVQLRLEQVSHDGLQVELLENPILQLAN